MTFFGEKERRSEHGGEERSRKRYAVSDEESAFISEQPNRVRLFDERRSKTSGTELSGLCDARYAVRDDEAVFATTRCTSHCKRSGRMSRRTFGMANLKIKKHIPKNVQMSATTYLPGQLPAKYFRHS